MNVRNCDVCGSTGIIGIVASGIAPVSYGKCSTCVSKGAEPIGIVLIWLAFNQTAGATIHKKKLVSFLDGKQVGWREITEYYSEHKGELLKEIQDEFEA